MQNIRVNPDEVMNVNNNIESKRDELIKYRDSLLDNLEQLSRYVLSSDVNNLIRVIEGKNSDLTNSISVDIGTCCDFLKERMSEYTASEQDTTNKIMASIDRMDNIAQGILSNLSI